VIPALIAALALALTARAYLTRNRTPKLSPTIVGAQRLTLAADLLAAEIRRSSL
jgi:hypothetical protein